MNSGPGECRKDADSSRKGRSAIKSRKIMTSLPGDPEEHLYLRAPTAGFQPLSLPSLEPQQAGVAITEPPRRAVPGRYSKPPTHPAF